VLEFGVRLGTILAYNRMVLTPLVSTGCLLACSIVWGLQFWHVFNTTRAPSFADFVRC
jgi:hypothetical protein